MSFFFFKGTHVHIVLQYKTHQLQYIVPLSCSFSKVWNIYIYILILDGGEYWKKKEKEINKDWGS